MGRKPTPTVLKLLAGNPGKRPLPKNEPKPKVGVPARPPAHLNDIAKAQWRKMKKQLEAARILTNLDAEALELYCTAYATYQEANQKIAEQGAVTVNDRGMPVRSP